MSFKGSACDGDIKGKETRLMAGRTGRRRKRVKGGEHKEDEGE